MSDKINELEQSMGVLMEKAGVDPQQVNQEVAKRTEEQRTDTLE
jgi:hypothetical protein